MESVELSQLSLDIFTDTLKHNSSCFLAALSEIAKILERKNVGQENNNEKLEYTNPEVSNEFCASPVSPFTSLAPAAFSSSACQPPLPLHQEFDIEENNAMSAERIVQVSRRLIRDGKKKDKMDKKEKKGRKDTPVTSSTSAADASAAQCRKERVL